MVEELDELIRKSERTCANCLHKDGDLCSLKTKRKTDMVSGNQYVASCSTCCNERDPLIYIMPAVASLIPSAIVIGIISIAAGLKEGTILSQILLPTILPIPTIVYFYLKSVRCGPNGKFWMPKEEDNDQI